MLQSAAISAFSVLSLHATAGGRMSIVAENNEQLTKDTDRTDLTAVEIGVELFMRIMLKRQLREHARECRC